MPVTAVGLDISFNIPENVDMSKRYFREPTSWRKKETFTPERMGAASWYLMHYTSIKKDNDPGEYMKNTIKTYPCMECRAWALLITSIFPIDKVGDYRTWTNNFHDAITEKIKKVSAVVDDDDDDDDTVNWFYMNPKNVDLSIPTTYPQGNPVYTRDRLEKCFWYTLYARATYSYPSCPGRKDIKNMEDFIGTFLAEHEEDLHDGFGTPFEFTDYLKGKPPMLEDSTLFIEWIDDLMFEFKKDRHAKKG